MYFKELIMSLKDKVRFSKERMNLKSTSNLCDSPKKEADHALLLEANQI